MPEPNLFLKNGKNEDEFTRELVLDIEKSENNNDYYKISGVASSYGNVDSWGDIFKEGSLDEELNKTIPLKADHGYDLNSIIGKVTLSKVGKKIRFEGELLKGDPLAEKVALMKASGIPLKTSIGGRILTSKWIKQDDKDVRVIEKGTIHELSIVTKGANPLAGVEKSEENKKMEDKQMDEILKELGILKTNFESFQKSMGEKKENETVMELKKSIEALQEKIEKSTSSEDMEFIKKAIQDLDEKIKAGEFAKGKETEQDFNKSLRRYIVKNHGDKIEKSIVSEYTKADVGFSDVAPIIEVPILDDMIKDLGVVSPLFAAARKITFKGPSATIPIRVKQPNNVKDVGLYEGTSGTKPVYNFKTIHKGVMQTEYIVPDELVADTKFDILGDLKEAAAADFGEIIGERILKGVLNITEYEGNKFEGIQTNTDFMNNQTIDQREAGKLHWQEIQAMFRKIPVSKRKNMALYASPEACDLMETMTDDMNRPLWRNSLTEGAPDKFMKYNVIEDEFMGREVGDVMLMFANMDEFYEVALDYDMNLETERKASQRATNTVTNSRMGGIVRDYKCAYGIKKVGAAPLKAKGKSAADELNGAI